VNKKKEEGALYRNQVTMKKLRDQVSDLTDNLAGANSDVRDLVREL